MRLGIDAANLNGVGGALVHIRALLQSARPTEHGFDRVVIWGSRNTLCQLKDQPWLEKHTSAALNGSLIDRSLWQKYDLPFYARAANIDLLFAPGSNVPSTFRPFVTMNRNMLPFDLGEIFRYRSIPVICKLLALRHSQAKSFRKAAGLIFLTEYARDRLASTIGTLAGRTAIIAHGVDESFRADPKSQRLISDCTKEDPFKILYASSISPYKNHGQVIDAMEQLRREGLPVALELAGPPYPPSLVKLKQAIGRATDSGRWITYHGPVTPQRMRDLYRDADLGLFASTCETFSIVLLEKMAASLPIACSNRGPGAELLGDTAFYFDARDPASIANAVRDFLQGPINRMVSAHRNHMRAKAYSWDRCARETFGFLAECV